MNSPITAIEAWKALGADPEYQPTRKDHLARGTQLWMLNKQGLLAVVPSAEVVGDAGVAAVAVGQARRT